MKFSTPISTTPISSKGDVGLKAHVGQGVFSDLCIKRITRDVYGRITSDATFEEFQKRFTYGSATGYSDFTQFIEGYYKYSKALFRTIIETKGGGITPRFERLGVSIDAPDVIDSDRVAVSGDGFIKVSYKKQFFSTPTVTVLQIGGSVEAIAKIIQTAEDAISVGATNITEFDPAHFFWVALVTTGGASSLAGDLVDGEVYWQAIGY